MHVTKSGNGWDWKWPLVSETLVHLINHLLKGQYINPLQLGRTYTIASKAVCFFCSIHLHYAKQFKTLAHFVCIKCSTNSQLWASHLWTIPFWENSAGIQRPARRRRETTASRKRTKYVFKYRNEQGRWSKVHTPFLWLSLVFANGFNSPRWPVQAHLIECGKFYLEICLRFWLIKASLFYEISIII